MLKSQRAYKKLNKNLKNYHFLKHKEIPDYNWPSTWPDA